MTEYILTSDGKEFTFASEVDDAELLIRSCSYAEEFGSVLWLPVTRAGEELFIRWGRVSQVKKAGQMVAF